MFVISTLVCGWGGFLLFHGADALPLWLVWTLGPLCWYLGGAAMLVTGSMTTYHYVAARSMKKAAAPEPTRVELMEFKKLIPLNIAAPVGLTREVPPMGGFVL
jgi:hypothetical protein